MLEITFLLLSATIADDKPMPKVPVSRDTTFVNGPLDNEGYVDYDAAFNERFGRGIKPNENAYALLLKALGPNAADERVREKFFKAVGTPIPPETGEYFVVLQDYLKNKTDLGFEQIDSAVKHLVNEAPRRPWTDKDHPHLATWLKANEKSLAIAVAASKRSEYFNPRASREWILDGLQKGTFTCRQITAALSARAALRLAEGDTESAWSDLLASHRLARLISRGPSAIEALMAIGIERGAIDGELAYLEHAKFDGKQLQSRLREIQALPPFSSMVEKIDVGSRFEFLDAAQAMRRGKLFTAKAKKDNDEDLRALNRLDWELIMREGNRWYGLIAAAMRTEKFSDRQKALEKVLDDYAAASKEATKGRKLADLLNDEKTAIATVSNAVGYALLGETMPAFQKVAQWGDEQEQRQRNLQIAFALAIYLSDNGKYAEKLDDLVPTYLKHLPGDLYSGKALVYRPTATGYLLYSVGPNLKDDDGRGDDLSINMPRELVKAKK
jgi:hypothetical protein